ncbi:hypothetical protein [Erwinia piriflorinigrans]|uniref:Type III secretion system protein n=1 Tax=Erwinia piriflorinigrans CFBP 5888 TaxID=1161919 RepID=V5Z750_9GAMM|nr:hypothetical protein [Erwinia piriflorinigrans]CCG87068.1 hypothetical protein EPIR_1703 [Erwinia piriflorinigrans CFBP 5888]
MSVWRKGRQLNALLEYKKTLVNCQVSKINKRLSEIQSLLEEKIFERKAIIDEINSLTPTGVLHRSDIYQKIRRQGVLLSKQQLIYHQINELEEDKEKNELNVQVFLHTRNVLEKKNHKFRSYFRHRYIDFRIRSENNIESELHETISYGREKY